MSIKKIKIAHIVPGMVFGGVEVGILKSYPCLSEKFDYDVFFVRKKGELDVGQRSVFFMLKMWVMQNKRHDLVLTSLWWSHIFGMLSLAFGAKWICFIHSTGSSSFLDRYFTRMALKFCNNIMFDSHATKKKFAGRYSGDSFVVPYVFETDQKEIGIPENPLYDLLWVGRNSKEKRLDLLVRLIIGLQSKSIAFRCCICIAGQNFKPLDEIVAVSDGQIRVSYNVSPREVMEFNCDSKMILCLSDYEGFSATTAEAVLCGNYAAARKVGDLPNYLCDESTIWLNDLDDASWDEFVNNIAGVIKDVEGCYSRRLISKKFTLNRLSGETYTESLSSAFWFIYERH